MIRGLFGRSDEVLSEYQRVGSELGVFTLSMVGIADPFDPDPCWDRKYGGQANIVEHLTGDRDFRLQAALDGCRNSKFVRDEAGRFREKNPVFTDVVVWIPGGPWKADAMRGGQRIEALARNLALLHRNKFSRSLPGDREPIYTIMPDDDLGDDMVAFQFGFGVFVPSGDDVLQAEIRLRRPNDDRLLELPDWSFWRNGGQIKRPVGVYRDQQSVLIAPTAESPIRAPIWFKHREGHILINLNAADTERIYADHDHIQVVETKSPADKSQPVEWVLEDRHASGAAADQIVVRMTPLGEPLKLRDTGPEKAVPTEHRTRKVDAGSAPPKPSRVQSAPRRESDSSGRRSGFGIDRLLSGLPMGRAVESTPISSRHMLRLVGIALLRIDGPRRLDGLLDWVIWLDEEGAPVTFDRASGFDTKTSLALSANSVDDRIQYRLANETEFKPVHQVPCVIPTASGAHLELVAPPMPDRYHGILMLNQDTAYPLSPKALVLGRSNINPESPQPDLPIELLTHPESLHWEGGAGYEGAKLNAINLSRRHISLTLKDGQLDLAMADGTAPVFVLGEDFKLIQKLEPRSNQHKLLEPGEMILVGNYLFRFHQEKTRTMSSAEATVVRRDPDA